jgi:hypothetical protein
MGDSNSLAIFDYQPGKLDEALQFLKRTRSELRELRCVRVWVDRFEVMDVNKDVFEIRGLGYPDSDIVAVLEAVQATYRPESIHQPPEGPFKEFKTGRRYPWAADRVM